ncbi:filamentous hemagglutinin N-terminal domain-containing protein [Tolypothrix campylonemoides VB511288]|nr:filamentous hemagglutinin N-terminal domain-containing protein [Tolypothrix campylonemoides VB511288]
MSKMATRWDALLGIAIAGAYTLSPNCVQAQITPDATLPNNSIVNINGNTFNITGGTQAGANLFHSFQQFSVPTGSGAFFNNTVDIKNIISRVTGGSISNIDGLIRTLGTANLFLINPNGIVFGQNARLDIGGSFFASTASSLKFADGFEFRTDGTQTTPLLTISVPLGLQFGQNPGKIQVQGDGQGRRTTTNLIDTTNALRLGANQTLGLVGGDLELSGGTLKSTGGRIELGSVGSDSLVGLVPVANGWTLDYGGVQNFRDIQLLEGTTVDASGIGGGNVRVQGRQITLKQGSRIEASNLGLGFQSGGTLEVTGIESIQIDGSGATYPAGVFTQVFRGANGNAGNIILTTGSLSLTNGAGVIASTYGQGDAGSILVQAKDSVSAAGNSVIFSNVERGAVGKGGDINITAATLSLKDGAQLGIGVRRASDNQPAGQGQAGNVNVNVTGAVTITGVKDAPSGIYSTLGRGAIGKGGNINVTSGSFSLTDGAQLDASTFGQGNAGSVFVQAKDSVSAAGRGGIFSTVENGGVGKGGNINITSGSLSLNDAQLITSTNGQGDAGSILVQAKDSISITGSNARINSAVLPSGVGKGGDINIRAATLSVTDGAQLQSAIFYNRRTGAAGRGDAGNVNIDVTGGVTIAEVNQTPSGIFSLVSPGGVGKGGNINITAGSFSLIDGATVSANTIGQGDAGTIQINATDAVRISGTNSTYGGSSVLSTETYSSGRGGDMIINTRTFTVSDGAVLDTRTLNDGNGGNIKVTANRVEAINGGQFLATSSGTGNAGKITVNATDQVIVNGSDATFNERIAKFGSTDNIESGASGLFVRSRGSGAAGDIEVTAPQIRLDNSARFNAESAFGNGGNINLQVGDLLLLRRGSFISATAGTDKLGGNGGNITINTPSGFIVANRGENSDITANAFSGSGGRVTISATDIFGIAPLSRQDLQRLRPDDLDPSKLQTNDITAISQTNPSLSGTVELNTPEIDPNSSLINLPTVPVDTEVAQGCNSPNYAQSSFVITGRGGLPPNPKDILTPDAVEVDWVTLNPNINNRKSPSVTTKPTTATPERIVEATGWVRNSKGEVILTANPPTTTPYESWQKPVSCRAS